MTTVPFRNKISRDITAFSNEWNEISKNEAYPKPSLVEFLNIYGNPHERAATFEYWVR
jgi:hypothetical protein